MVKYYNTLPVTGTKRRREKNDAEKDIRRKKIMKKMLIGLGFYLYNKR